MFRYELNFIETIRGWAQAYHKVASTYNYQALRDSLWATFDKTMPIAFEYRVVDQCFHFMDGYRKGLTGPVLEYAVKKRQLEKIEKEYLMKQDTIVRFKHSKRSTQRFDFDC